MPSEHSQDTKRTSLTGLRGWVVLVFTVLALSITVIQIFRFRPFGLLIFEMVYYYILIALFLPLVFLLVPLKKGKPSRQVVAIDAFLAVLTFGVAGFFAYHGYDIVWYGWAYSGPFYLQVLAIIFWLLVTEAARRTGGTVFAVVIFVASLYPIIAPYMPTFLKGQGYSLAKTALSHSLSSDSIVGIPIRVFSDLFIGYMVFGAALEVAGGGQFFLKLAMSFLGGRRGGVAKVAVFASALFGTMSGSAIANVIACGSFTIPAMKKTGFAPDYAGGIEACASTGGIIMPPVMGAVAFVMAALIGVPYATVMVAAAVPSILYYFGLFIQVDSYAALKGLSGLPKSEIPLLRQTLRQGWFYLLSLFMLVYILLYLKLEAQAPFFATAVLLLCAMVRKETRFTLRSFLEFIASMGRMLATLVGILAASGIIIGAFSMTGVAYSFARELVWFSGGNPYFMLLFGALASFILGMGMSVTACYIFLAIVLAPALVSMGFDIVAVHFFVLYWGILSNITPPVALAAFAAAAIAKASPMKVAVTATRLAGVVYIIPFFFVLSPALILRGSPGSILLALGSAILGIYLMAGALHRYLAGIGKLEFFSGTVGAYLPMVSLVIAGVLLGLPFVVGKILGLVIASVTICGVLLYRRTREKLRLTRSRVG